MNIIKTSLLCLSLTAPLAVNSQTQCNIVENDKKCHYWVYNKYNKVCPLHDTTNKLIPGFHDYGVVEVSCIGSWKDGTPCKDRILHKSYLCKRCRNTKNYWEDK